MKKLKWWQRMLMTPVGQHLFYLLQQPDWVFNKLQTLSTDMTITARGELVYGDRAIVLDLAAGFRYEHIKTLPTDVLNACDKHVLRGLVAASWHKERYEKEEAVRAAIMATKL
jgi:hypothetical protein